MVAALTYIADERMRDTQNPALIAIADHFRSVPGEKGVAETMHRPPASATSVGSRRA